MPCPQPATWWVPRSTRTHLPRSRSSRSHWPESAGSAAARRGRIDAKWPRIAGMSRLEIDSSRGLALSVASEVAIALTSAGAAARLVRTFKPIADQDAVPPRCFQAFGQDPAQLSSVGLEVVGPANADRWAAQLELVERLDHRDRRRQCEPRLVFDRQPMHERIDRESERQAAGVRPPFMGAPAPAVGLRASPDHERQHAAALAHQLGGPIAGRIDNVVDDGCVHERPGRCRLRPGGGCSLVLIMR